VTTKWRLVTQLLGLPQQACAGADKGKPVAPIVRPGSPSVSQTHPVIPASVSRFRPIRSRPTADKCKPLHLRSSCARARMSVVASRNWRFCFSGRSSSRFCAADGRSACQRWSWWS